MNEILVAGQPAKLEFQHLPDEDPASRVSNLLAFGYPFLYFI